MWRIVKTTDNKYLGRLLVEPNKNDEIVFDDGFIFKVERKIKQDSIIIIVNDNYIITLQRS
jgi:preprotein translocase subunit YajC